MEATAAPAADPALPPQTPPVLRNLRRLEWYIRFSGYFLVGLPGVLACIMVASAVAPEARWSDSVAARGGICCLLALGCAALQVTICHTAFSHLRSAAQAPVWHATRNRVATGMSLAGTAALIVVAPGPLIAVPAVVWLLMGLVGAYVPVLAWRRFAVVLGVIAGCCVVAAVLLAVFLGATVSGMVVGGVTGGLFYLATTWVNAWMMRVIWELDRLRRMAPQLAVAEERLRFSRDLHDTFGRTLSVVAVKSELATELARRGHGERAADEMASVRQIAEDAGREVRAVVRGYRQADLDQELQGARSILESAGIRCSIDRDGAGSQQHGPVAITLAWVVREAVTNVIRHSEATWCRLRLEAAPEAVTLYVDNDGVPVDGAQPQEARQGHGLVGLAERLRPAGGTLRHERRGEEFHLAATVPTPASGTGG